MIIFSSHVRVFHLIQLYSARHLLNISSTTDDRYYKFIQLLFLVPASKVVLDPRTTFFWHDMISYKYEYAVHTLYTIPTGTVHMYSIIKYIILYCMHTSSVLYTTSKMNLNVYCTDTCTTIYMYVHYVVPTIVFIN